jgi:hypothetical protein
MNLSPPIWPAYNKIVQRRNLGLRSCIVITQSSVRVTIAGGPFKRPIITQQAILRTPRWHTMTYPTFRVPIGYLRTLAIIQCVPKQ